MRIKIHEAYRGVVALSDSDLIGKTFVEGKRQIEVKPSFFDGEEKSREEILEVLRNMDREDATFNIVGKESVSCAVEAGIISDRGVIRIDGVPVALGLL
ncbi:hypothetical protein CMI42_03025 [Candidatus Pacearchaeota archaeon]|nr:hypothetical protein [Candidatus Pacearchaeota archaeon]